MSSSKSHQSNVPTFVFPDARASFAMTIKETASKQANGPTFVFPDARASFAMTIKETASQQAQHMSGYAFNSKPVYR
jgi:hypothetical protein